jgi:hypothetical protein
MRRTNLPGILKKGPKISCDVFNAVVKALQKYWYEKLSASDFGHNQVAMF